MARQTDTPGYAMGSKRIPQAPITTKELRMVERSALFEDADREALRRSGKVLEPHLDALVHDWIDFLLDHDHLNAAFRGPEAEGEIIPRYVDAVRARLKEWVRDTTEADHDQEWLDYQFEIGRRLHREKKNRTDDVDAEAHVPYRHLVPALVPFITHLRPYLEDGGASAEEVDRMLGAWTKSLTIQIALWSGQYVGRNDL